MFYIERITIILLSDVPKNKPSYLSDAENVTVLPTFSANSAVNDKCEKQSQFPPKGVERKFDTSLLTG